MDAESAEHKGTLAPEHPSLSVVSSAPVSAEWVLCRTLLLLTGNSACGSPLPSYGCM